MAVVEREVAAAPPQPHPRQVWLKWVILAASLLGAVLEGFLFGEENPDKYRPFAPGDPKGWPRVTALRWISRLVFIVALLTWLQLALKATRQPETWAATRKRTGAFVVMVGAGLVAIVLSPKKPRMDE